MELKAEQIQANWDKLLGYINTYISEPRREKLIEFYNKFSDRIVMMPASHKKEYHNAFPGGYVEHVLNITNAVKKVYSTWKECGAHINFTEEEMMR